MVKTIFYFCPTEEEYNRLIQDANENGGISAKTITFVEDSGSIYLNGRRYGIGSLADYTTKSEFNEEKIRTTKSVNDLNNAINQAVLEDKNLITTIKNNLEAMLIRLNREVSEAHSDIQTVSSDLNSFKNTIAQEVEQDITDAITNSQGRTIWTELEQTRQGVETITNKISESLDENGNVKYTSALQSVISTGIENDESFADIQSRWALLDDNEDILRWIASGFTSHAEEGESFASVFATMVDDAASEEGSMYSGLTSRIETLENAGYVASSNLAAEIETILGTSLVSLALKSDITEATSELASRISTLEGTTYAGLQTRIENLEDAGFLVTADLQTEVESILGHQLSEIALMSDVDGSVAMMSSRMDEIENSIDQSIESLAQVTTRVNKNSAVVDSLASFDDNQSITWNYATVDEAVAGMFASGTTDTGRIVEAMITASVDDEISHVTISADQIDLDGNVIAQRLTAAGAALGGWTIESNELSSDVVDEFTEYDEEGIPLPGWYKDEKSMRLNATACAITMSRSYRDSRGVWSYDSELDLSGLRSIFQASGDASGIMNGFRIESGKGIQIYNEISGPREIDSLPEYSNTYEAGIPISLNCDGSGWLGNGGITWDTSGKFAIKQIDSLEAVQDHNGTEITTALENGEFKMSSAVTAGGGVRTESTNVQPDGVRITVNNTAMDLTNQSFLTYYGFQTNYGNKTGSYGTSINIYGDPTGEHPQPTTIFKVSDEGNVTANSFAKIGGSSNEVLMADGSTMTLVELKAALDAL